MIFRPCIIAIIIWILNYNICFSQNTPSANKVGKIAATINDNIISLYDVEQRFKLFIFNSKITVNEYNRTAIQQQIVNNLIDETLKSQEIKQNKIIITPEEVSKSLNYYIKSTQPNKSEEEFLLHLGNLGISSKTIRQQINKDLAWRKFIQQRWSGRISLSETEINERFKKLSHERKETRVNYSEIFLPITKIKSRLQTLKTAQELRNTIIAGGNFEFIAKEFSQSNSSKQGGNIGSVILKNVNMELSTTLKKMKPGEISQPIKTETGIYIVKLNHHQKGDVNPMNHLFDLLVLSFDKDSPSMSSDITKIKKNFRSCKETEKSAKQYTNNIYKTGMLPLGSLSNKIRNTLKTLEAGEISPNMTTPEGVNLFVVCDRKDAQSKPLSLDEVENTLYGRKLSIIAKRVLRDLRHDAIIEYHDEL